MLSYSSRGSFWFLVLGVFAYLVGCNHAQPAVAPSASSSPETIQPVSVKPAEKSGIPPAPMFREVAKEAGLNYEWKISGKRPLTILQTIGNGCAFLDYNNDGNLDVLLVGERLALYKGDGEGKFADVSHETGTDAFKEHFLGCAVGDYDNDGDDDLYISGWRCGVLLHNDNGRFRDVTESLGLEPQPWGSSCGFADLDSDGYLDLYITNYVTFGPDTEPQLCTFKGRVTGCGPVNYEAEKNVLYHNEGGKRFRDVTKAWKAGGSGKGLGVAFADFNRSGRMSFVVANDLMPANLYVNGGKGRLENKGQDAGISLDEGGQTYAGMGVDWGDIDNDGRPDIYIANFGDEMKCLYHNEDHGVFQLVTEQTGVDKPTRPYVGWGCKFFDADNDGWLDLLLAHGHVQDNIDKYEKATYKQPTVFLHNQGGSHPIFKDITRASGVGSIPNIMGRGLAVGDYDNDGRMDALVVDSEGRPYLLHNETKTSDTSWIGFHLVGSGSSNRNAYGAKIRIVTGSEKRYRQCHPGGSYLSSSDARLHFGLKDDSIESVTIWWPDGSAQSWSDLKPGKYYTVKQGERPTETLASQN